MVIYCMLLFSLLHPFILLPRSWGFFPSLHICRMEILPLKFESTAFLLLPPLLCISRSSTSSHLFQSRFSRLLTVGISSAFFKTQRKNSCHLIGEFHRYQFKFQSPPQKNMCTHSNELLLHYYWRIKEFLRSKRL